MNRICIAGTTMAALGLLAGAAVAVDHHTTRPCPRPNIPLHDYQYRDRSVAVSAVSRVGILLKKSTREVEQLVAEPPPVLAATTEVTAQDIERVQPLEGERVQVNRDRVETFSANEESLEGELRREERRQEIRPRREEEDWTDRAGRLWGSLLGRSRRREPAAPLEPIAVDGARTFTGRVVEHLPPPPRAEPVRINLYQLDRPSLQIDQCEISGVALLLDDQGGWVLSLRADQNRRAEGEGFVPTLYVKRNLFTVRLRCYGNFANEPTQAALDSGKPLLAAIQPPGFWVENGQPKYLRLADQDELIQRYFELIDRVEIEFFYR